MRSEEIAVKSTGIPISNGASQSRRKRDRRQTRGQDEEKRINGKNVAQTDIRLRLRHGKEKIRITGSTRKRLGGIGEASRRGKKQARG